MNWPWVSRFAYDQLAAELGRLREQNVQLVDAMTRISRHEAGMPEAPRKERPSVEAMPQRLRKYIAGFENSRIRDSMERGAWARHRKGEPWETIVATVMPKEDESGERPEAE